VTDLAARGIDIPLLENVIHFDFPTRMKLFIHRSGRTARAGQSGTSYAIITNDELGYLHDLSIFVGRKHFDRVENIDSLTDTEKEAEVEKLGKDPESICYGTLPQHLLDEYCQQVAKVWDKYREQLEPLQKSIKNAATKYNRTKEPASKNSVALMRELTQERPINIHPMLVS
jgi:ATP-dependent RNA helicase DDX54/DBP10